MTLETTSEVVGSSGIPTLVLNLARFGDILQSQPVMVGLAADTQALGLVCQDRFSGASALLRGNFRRLAAPTASLASAAASDWRAGLGSVWSFLHDELACFRGGTVVNLTPDLPARLLARLLEPSSIRGFAVDEHGFGLNVGGWAAFLQASSVERVGSPFNMVDLFRRVAGLPPSGGVLELAAPRESALERAADLLSGAPTTRAGFLGVQLGASEDRRRWPVDSFATVAGEVWRRHGLVTVLLGSPGERSLAERFRSLVASPVVDLVGATDLPTLAAALSRMTLLLTNDTGTMHLAAGLGAPVAAIFLATAQPWDTGPCRPGNLCLEPDLACHPCAFGARCPDDLACRRAVGPEVVLGHLDGYLANGCFSEMRALGARAWLTTTDGDGYHDLVSLSGHARDARTAWIRLLRHTLSRFFDKQPVEAWPGPALPLSSEQAASVSRRLREAQALFGLLEQQGALLGMAPREALKSKFLAGCQRVGAILEGEPLTAALGRLWSLESRGQSGDLGAALDLIRRFRGLLAALETALS